jgi:hypothetical protein
MACVAALAGHMGCTAGLFYHQRVILVLIILNEPRHIILNTLVPVESSSLAMIDAPVVGVGSSLIA